MIWALPLEWQLLHRLFLGDSLTAELQNHEEIPTKDGMSFVRGGANRFYMSMDDGSDKIGDRDISGWDLSVPEWIMRDDAEIRKRLCLNSTPWWCKMVDLCYDSLLLVDVILSDGTVMRQTLPGIVKSGSLTTLSANSRGQVILKVLFVLETLGYFDEVQHKIVATGDDSLERLHNVDKEKFQRWLTDHGFLCKEFEEGKMADRVFCSHKFILFRGQRVPVPTNWDKHKFALSVKAKNELRNYPEQLFSLMLEYAFVDDVFEQLRRALAEIKPEIAFSQERIQGVVLGLETRLALPKPSNRCDPLQRQLAYMTTHTIMEQEKLRLVCVENNPGPQAAIWLVALLLCVASARCAPCALRCVAAREGDIWCFPDKTFFEIDQTASLLKLSESNGKIANRAFDYVTTPVRRAFNAVTHSLVPLFDQPKTREISAMPPKGKRGKSGQQKMAQGKMKRKAVQAARAIVAVEKAIVGGKKKMKTKRGGNKLGFLAANRFNMDRAQFAGRDLVAKIVLSGAASSQTSGKDIAGTNLWQTTIRPQIFIPNTRLSRLMGLFLKWRLRRARFVFKSSLPPGTNAGTMLFVHEPDPNETIPAQYAAPLASTLSNYDSHGIKALVPMAKYTDDFKGERNDHLDLRPDQAVGATGGWFMLDPENAATAVENSMGQFAIFVQDAHNILGANAYLPTTQYEIGSLFFEYDIEVQTAADNDSFAAGYSEFILAGGSNALAPVNYADTGAEASSTFSTTGGIPIPTSQAAAIAGAKTNWYVDQPNNQNGVKMTVQWDGTNEWWGFPSSGVYLFFLHIGITTAADVGASAAHVASNWGLKTGIGGTGSILSSAHVDSTTISIQSSTAWVSYCIVNIEDPELDFLSPGTTNFSTAVPTTRPAGLLRVLALPEVATKLLRQNLKREREEKKTIEDQKGMIEDMFAEYLRKHGFTPEFSTVAAVQTSPQVAVAVIADESPKDWVRLALDSERRREELKVREPVARATSRKA
jgi:hypothetical protein